MQRPERGLWEQANQIMFLQCILLGPEIMLELGCTNDAGSWSRSGKLQEEETSPNHEQVLFPAPVQTILPLPLQMKNDVASK